MLDLSKSLLFPELCYIVKTHEDLLWVEKKIRHFQRAFQVETGCKAVFIAFKITNHSCKGESKDSYLQSFKEIHGGYEHPFFNLERLPPVDGWFAVMPILTEIPKCKFNVDDNGKLVQAGDEKYFLLEGMYSADILGYAIDRNDCVMFGKKYIRYHEKPFRSEMYVPGSSKLVEVIYPAKSFEFALEGIDAREHSLKMD